MIWAERGRKKVWARGKGRWKRTDVGTALVGAYSNTPFHIDSNSWAGMTNLKNGEGLLSVQSDFLPWPEAFEVLIWNLKDSAYYKNP